MNKYPRSQQQRSILILNQNNSQNYTLHSHEVCSFFLLRPLLLNTFGFAALQQKKSHREFGTRFPLSPFETLSHFY